MHKVPFAGLHLRRRWRAVPSVTQSRVFWCSYPGSRVEASLLLTSARLLTARAAAVLVSLFLCAWVVPPAVRVRARGRLVWVFVRSSALPPASLLGSFLLMFITFRLFSPAVPQLYVLPRAFLKSCDFYWLSALHNCLVC